MALEWNPVNSAEAEELIAISVGLSIQNIRIDL
jgi:hypothetical protein